MAADTGKLAYTDRGPNPETLFSRIGVHTDLHGTSYELKVLTSTTTTEGLTIYRKAC